MVLEKIQLLNSTYTIIDNALRQQIANRYNENISYSINDFCIYDNKLYKCIENTQGEWDSSCWELKRITELSGSGSVIYYIDNMEQEECEIIERTISEVTHPALTIRNLTFYYCTSLQQASFPNCSTIGNSAFAYCSSLQSVSFPKCSTIGGFAFNSCSSLQSVSFPSCTTIGDYAFIGCTSLQSVSFPNCSTIASGAFWDCTSLQSVNFPNCSTIVTYAFRNCTSLQSIYLLSTSVCTLSSTDAFGGTPISNSTYIGKFGSIYVPSSLVSAYKTATNWATYSSRITSYTG